MPAEKMFIRIGRVAVFRRGAVWYLDYHQHGRRHRARVGRDRLGARRLASQIDAQLESDAPTALNFEPISLSELQTRWLAYLENVRRASLATLRRYRAASAHLLRFVDQVQPVRYASQFSTREAETFAGYLRRTPVAPNGHARAARRPLRDRGIRFILGVCRTLFNYAAKRRHLSPYAENPFAALELDRMRINDSKPCTTFDDAQERALLERCDDWQFPIFLTLLLTGLRPGELVHLLLPEDLDLQEGWLHVRNKADLGWQVKTRCERRIPLVPELVEVLRFVIGPRTGGTVFVRRRFTTEAPPLAGRTRRELVDELAARQRRAEGKSSAPLDRPAGQRVAETLWRDLGLVLTDLIRLEFMRLTHAIGIPEVTAPKTTRHTFATGMQDANTDPLIRNQLMGHAPSSGGSIVAGLGMTGIYTHTRLPTLRRQLEQALQPRAALDVARRWLAKG